MTDRDSELVVYYDGSCPGCVRDRERYQRLAGRRGESVRWVDITGRDDELRRQGIEPDQALQELHVKDARGRIHRELDAYILLMSRVPALRPLAWLIGLPGLRQLLSWLYRVWVTRRLRKTGRMPDH
ncbi:MAG: DUF393 domain-containing protein [Marinobacter sp.]|uniref:thiol-disulfide oxidoreductase DCC family protein n=1 Tax=Marinobacter sp. TaxID=50741 RepID=UPI00299EB854|nr:DUF393 domain-containing protein [Marinobacter sp.]MDX1635031.1 DUF393 domain-containing protein [Marinobacter sp.]